MIGVEAARMVGAFVRAEVLSRVATAAAGSGEVAESSVGVLYERDEGAGTNVSSICGTPTVFLSTRTEVVTDKDDESSICRAG